MTEAPLQAALARLDRAVGRLEEQVPTQERRAPGLAEAYALLDERHGLLRLRIQETIERLDQLIAGAGDGDAR